MTPTNPKLFIHAMYNHYEALEHLARLSIKLDNILDEETVYSVLRQHNQPDTVSEYDVFSSLLAKGILIKDTEDGLFIQQDVLKFILSINNETTLEMAGFIQLRFKAVESALDTIDVTSWNSDDIRNFSRRVDTEFKAIFKQLINDQKAIHDMAIKLKLATGKTLQYVYEQILDACATYINPLLTLIDTREGNEFQVCISRTINVLNNAIQYIDSQPCPNDKLKRLVNAAILTTRSISKNGRPILVDCGDTLFPLKESILAQNKTQQAVSFLLGRIAKVGVPRTFKSVKMPYLFRFNQAVDLLDVSHKTLNTVYPYLNFKVQNVEFPSDIGPDDSIPAPDIIDMNAILNTLNNSLPISDLLQWVSNYRKDWTDDTKLKVYNDLIMYIGDKLVITDTVIDVLLQNITSRHNMHTFQDNEGY